MSRCRHRNVVEWSRVFVEGHPFWYGLRLGATPDHISCANCGEWLPLGPANDTPKTRVEIHAAATVAKQAPMTDAEWKGWWAYLRGEDTPTGTIGAAGWLAAAIYTHKEDK